MSIQEFIRNWHQERATNQEKSRKQDISKKAEEEICVADSEGGRPYVYVCGVRLFVISDKSDIKARTISLADVPEFLSKMREEYVKAKMKSGEPSNR